MKTVKGIEQVIYGIDERPKTRVIGTNRDGTPETTPLTVKYVLADILAQGHTEDPVGAMATALKIRQANNKVDLEQSEMTLLDKAIKASGYLDVIRAEAIKVLAAAETPKAKE